MKQTKFELYESLKSIFLHIDNHEKVFLGQYGLNVPRFYVLMHVENNPGINYILLSELLLCTKSNTTRVVRGMQKDGLINREVDPNDRRSYRLTLSKAGRDLFNRVYPDYKMLVDGLMSKLDKAKLEDYLKASSEIENTLTPNRVEPIPS
ncbi:MAG: MarR family transcriptional regulator [Anaerolineaceae bacterium]|jgi:DNA-binding MarR family transcriptional regulator|nr:MarR family transcriptional regulator [Anaerolineaceae bacterium]HQJ32068.1 MarR family transcriptional regulator [Anaerolineaceae bacterium]